ncbi:hypothetical protein ACFXCZ_19840 [Streptomyces sp. NPDC059396]|uniref:hypothetical protein n=1 Tax=Streptomyces sp. NPDC059396 TaxID=3346819 RepID=UPI00368F7678
MRPCPQSVKCPWPATSDTPGAWWRGLRLLALDGTQFDLPDSVSNGDTFDGRSTTGGLPFGSPR